MAGEGFSSPDGYDPFTPEPVYGFLDDGTVFIDPAAVAEHVAAPLPEIDSSVMEAGDVLVVEFEDEHQETFEVASLQSGSLVFASEDITQQSIALKRRSENSADEESAAAFPGSSLMPSGALMTADTLRAGSYMFMNFGISTSPVRTFDLQRPDEHGSLRSVALNKSEGKKPESSSFADVKHTFTQLERMLEAEGYHFGDTEPEVDLGDGYMSFGGMLASYRRVAGKQLVYAARQGFGCAITPQDEIYTYDAAAQVLRGIRNIPSKGILQTMVAEGVSEDVFQEAFIAYRDGNEPDWRYPLTLSRSGLHALSNAVPITSHTWLSPTQEKPTTTVLEQGENVSELFKTPTERGASITGALIAHDAEDLVDSLEQVIGINPHDTTRLYDHLEVNIYPNGSVEHSPGNSELWGSDEQLELFADQVREATRVTLKPGGLKLDVDGHIIDIKTDAVAEARKMIAVAQAAMA